LTVPHLRMAVRRFVLAPLAEIAPEAVEPVTKRTARDLLANLDRQPKYLALSRSLWGVLWDRCLFSRLISELDATGLTEGDLLRSLHYDYEFEEKGKKAIARIDLEQKARELH